MAFIVSSSVFGVCKLVSNEQENEVAEFPNFTAKILPSQEKKHLGLFYFAEVAH
jgi:hypothetical protein